MEQDGVTFHGWQEVGARLVERCQDRALALFADFDGTLTPIVDRPDAAFLPDGVRRSLERLATCHKVALVSGRSLSDLRGRAQVEGAVMAGSHGYEIEGRDVPPSPVADEETAERIARAAALLEERLRAVPGASVEPKRFAVTAHWRHVPPDRVPAVEAAVDAVGAELGGLRKTGGKMVFELRPEQPWDKGRAVQWILDHLHGSVLPAYIGDDVTDLDGLRAVRDAGFGIVVGDTLPEGEAVFRLREPSDVAALLRHLAERLGR